MIIAAQQRLGNAWTRIAELIGNGRPPNGIKNRWNSCLRFRQHAAAAAMAAVDAACPRTFQVLPPPPLRTPEAAPLGAPGGSFAAARPGRGMPIVLPPLTALSPAAASPTQTQSSSSCSATTSPLLPPAPAPVPPLLALPPLRARSTPVAARPAALCAGAPLPLPAPASPDSAAAAPAVRPVTLPAFASLSAF